MFGGRELSDIEQMVKGCLGCQSVQKMPAHAPLHSWEWPNKPGQRVHVDYAGHFQGTIFLIVMDAHTKGPEVISTQSKTSCQVCNNLKGTKREILSAKELIQSNHFER